MSLSLTELKEKTPTQLAAFARELNLQNVTRMRRQDQIFSILKTQAKRGEKIKGEVLLRYYKTVMDSCGRLVVRI